MPLHLICPRCKTLLSISEENANKAARCPKCSQIFKVGVPPAEKDPEPIEEIEWVEDIEEREPQKVSPSSVRKGQKQAAPAALSPDWGDSPTTAKGKSLGEGVVVPVLEPNFKRVVGKVRRRFLRGVSRGLALHYVIPFLFLIGLGAGVMGLILTISARVFGFDTAVDAATVFFLICSVLFLLTGALAITATALVLAGGNLAGRGLLLTCLGLLVAGSTSAALILVLPLYGSAFFAAALVLLFMGWGCWAVFLSRVGSVLRREEVSRGAEQTLWAAVGALAGGLPFLLLVGFLVAAMVKRPFLILWIPGGFVAAVVMIAYQAGGFDSILGLALAPTGIPFTLEYLNFVSGLRMLIERRA